MVREVSTAEDIDRVMEYVKAQNLPEPPTWDAIRTDTFGAIMPELHKGYVLYTEKDGQVDGFVRASATMHGSTVWLQELHSTAGNEEKLFNALKDRCTSQGVTHFIYLPGNPWTEAIDTITGQEDPGMAAVRLPWEYGNAQPEVYSYVNVEMEEYSRSPLITSASTMEDLEKCYELQKMVNWGELSHPPRLIIPDAFFDRQELGTGHMAVARNEDGQVIGYVRTAYTFTEGVVYGEDAVVHPDWQKKGIGRALDQTMTFICLSRGVRVGYGTVDPLNIASLRAIVSVLNMRGVRVVKNLYGRWDIHGDNEPTHRIFVMLDGSEHSEDEPDGYSHPGDFSAFESATVVLHDTKIPAEEITRANIDGRKNEIMSLLEDIINSRGYSLVSVVVNDTLKYKFKRE